MSGTLPAGIPTTARGENKDQYGNKFGKKHVEAMFKFSETHWSSDIRTTLKTLLKIDIGQKAFLKFLKAEYGKVQLEGYLEFQVSKRSHIYQHIAGFFSKLRWNVDSFRNWIIWMQKCALHRRWFCTRTWWARAVEVGVESAFQYVTMSICSREFNVILYVKYKNIRCISFCR